MLPNDFLYFYIYKKRAPLGTPFVYQCSKQSKELQLKTLNSVLN